MKDASDFDCHLELPETRNSFLYDSSELFKKRSLWLRRFVLCQINPQMEYQMFTTGNSWLEEWWRRKEDTPIPPRKVFCWHFLSQKCYLCFLEKRIHHFVCDHLIKGRFRFEKLFKTTLCWNFPQSTCVLNQQSFLLWWQILCPLSIEWFRGCRMTWK